MQKYLQDLGIVAQPLVLSVGGGVECCHISVHVLENQGEWKEEAPCLPVCANEQGLGFNFPVGNFFGFGSN